jgi:hypothetical protein
MTVTMDAKMENLVEVELVSFPFDAGLQQMQYDL